MSFETLRYEVVDAIATITLDRPAKLNAYTPQMGHEIVEAMRRADGEPGVRVVIADWCRTRLLRRCRYQHLRSQHPNTRGWRPPPFRSWPRGNG